MPPFYLLLLTIVSNISLKINKLLTDMNKVSKYLRYRLYLLVFLACTRFPDSFFFRWLLDNLLQEDEDVDYNFDSEFNVEAHEALHAEHMAKAQLTHGCGKAHDSAHEALHAKHMAKDQLTHGCGKAHDSAHARHKASHMAIRMAKSQLKARVEYNDAVWRVCEAELKLAVALPQINDRERAAKAAFDKYHKSLII